MTKIPLREFVRQHRDEIDKKITAAIGRPTYPVSELERVVWVGRDKRLNKWAKRRGME